MLGRVRGSLLVLLALGCCSRGGPEAPRTALTLGADATIPNPTAVPWKQRFVPSPSLFDVLEAEGPRQILVRYRVEHSPTTASGRADIRSRGNRVAARHPRIEVTRHFGSINALVAHIDVTTARELVDDPEILSLDLAPGGGGALGGARPGPHLARPRLPRAGDHR